MLEKKYIGETEAYDKKEQVEKNQPKSWLKTVCAFANGNGGKIIFGIKEDNTIIGLTDIKTDSEFISTTIKEKVEPIPDFKLLIESINKKDFIILEVKGGKDTPYVYKEGGSLTAYKRVGNHTVPASRLDFYNLALKGQNMFYDETLSNLKREEVTFNDLTIEYKERAKKDFCESDLISFGLMKSNGILTVAGTLFADRHLVINQGYFVQGGTVLRKTVARWML